MVLVSVILPSYNYEKYISESIESILNQSFKDFELIIVDNDSTDNSQEIIKNYQQHDDRIKLLFHDKNEGISKSLNDGLDMAKGKYIAFNCTDDIWDEKKLEKQLKILEKDENLIVWNECEIIDRNGKPFGKKFTEYHNALKIKKSGNIFYELFNGNFICFSTLIFKKDILEKFRFNEYLKILFDYKLEVDLASKYKFYFINEILTKYRLHGENTVLKRPTLLMDSLYTYKYFFKKYNKKLPKKLNWSLLTSVIMVSLEHMDKKNARPYVIKALRLYPLNPVSLRFFAMSFINSSFILTVIQILLKYYLKVIKKNFPIEFLLHEKTEGLFNFLNKL